MGAYTTLAVDSDQLTAIINTIRTGYVHNGQTHRASVQIALALSIEYNLGIRVSDVVTLKLADIVRDGDHYRLDVVEQKTGNVCTHRVPTEYYSYLAQYCKDNNIGTQCRIVPLTTRAIQKAIKTVREYLGIADVSTHSMRKAAGQDIYEQSGHDIETVREFYGHRSTITTQRYLKLSTAQLDRAIADHVRIM